MFHFFSLVLCSQCKNVGRIKHARTFECIKIRSYVIQLRIVFLSLCVLYQCSKPYFHSSIYSDRDLLLFVSKSRKTEMFISQIIFFLSFSSFRLLFHFVCARSGISHTNQAQNDFRNCFTKCKSFSISFTVWHGSTNALLYSYHSWTLVQNSLSQKNLSWLLIFTGTGLLWKLCKWAASNPLCARMWFAFMDFFVCHRRRHTTAAFKTVPADAVNGNLTIEHTAHRREQKKNLKWYFNRDDDTLTDFKNTHLVGPFSLLDNNEF